MGKLAKITRAITGLKNVWQVYGQMQLDELRTDLGIFLMDDAGRHLSAELSNIQVHEGTITAAGAGTETYDFQRTFPHWLWSCSIETLDATNMTSATQELVDPDGAGFLLATYNQGTARGGAARFIYNETNVGLMAMTQQRGLPIWCPAGTIHRTVVVFAGASVEDQIPKWLISRAGGAGVPVGR